MDLLNKVYSFKLLSDSLYYKLAFVLWALIHNTTIGQYFTSYFSIIFIAWGLLLVLKQLFSNKAYLSKLQLGLIYAFLASYGLTIIANYQHNLIGNSKTLVWQIILIFIMFFIDKQKDEKQVVNELKTIARFVVLTTFILSFISVVTYFLRVEIWINRVDGTLIPQGYFQGRLWGIYVDPNQGAVIAMVSMLCSLMVLPIKNKYLKVFNIFAFIIQYLFMLLAHSRGGELGLIFFLFGIFYMIALKRKLKMVFSIILAIVLSMSVYLSLNFQRKIVSEIAYSPIFDSIANSFNESTGGGGSVNPDRTDTDSSNGRVELWLDGIELFTKAPVLGFGDRNISYYAGEYLEDSQLAKKTIHNGFLHMLLSGGLLSLSIMIVFIIISTINALKVFFNKELTKSTALINYLSIGLIVLLATAMFLTEIFYQNSFLAVMFWLFLGYNTYLTNVFLKEK